MATDQSSSAEYSKVHAIIDHAHQLLRWSKEPPDASIPFPDPEVCFKSLPLSRDEVSTSDLFSLQDAGAQLWNACCGFNRDDQDARRRKLNAIARAFAYLTLESAPTQKQRRSPQESPRAQSGPPAKPTLRVAITAARDCLACDLIDLAEKIIDCLSKHQELLADPSDQRVESDEDSRVRADIFLLRITHAWRRSRFDLAEHFYSTLHNRATLPKLLWTGDAADLYYEIGSSALVALQAEIAVQWLRHALAALEQVDQDTTQLDVREHHFNVSHTLVRALLATDDPEAGEEALSLLNNLKQTHGQKLPVMLLDIELLAKDSSPNADAYFAAISKITRCVHIIEQNHKIIMYYLHRLKAFRSLAHASRALKNYIVQRLSAEENSDRIQSAIVTLIWMALSDSTAPDTVHGLSEDLDAIHASWTNELDLEAAHAAALIVWKCVNALSEDLRGLSIAWCRVGLHPLMVNVGEHNKAKLQRKLIYHHMESGNVDEAARLQKELSPSAQTDIPSRYLSYLLALRVRDEDAADAAIKPIAAASNQDHQLLLACVGETMKYGSKKRGALLMQRILDKLSHNLPATFDRCALLRCTARLHLSVLEEDRHPDDEHVTMLCSIFRAAAMHTENCNAAQSGASPTPCPLDECVWFEKMSFNVALQHANHWPAKVIVDLLAHSAAIIYPEGVDATRVSEQKRHRLIAAFLQLVILVQQARNWNGADTLEDVPRTSYHARSPPENSRLQRHLYETVLMRYQQLRGALSGRDDDAFDRDHKKDLKSKTAAMLPLAFEAQLFIALSDILDGISFPSLALIQLIDDIPTLTDSSRPYSLIADLVLTACISCSPTRVVSSSSIRIPTILPIQHAVELLVRVIVAMRNLDRSYDVTKAARWIRCVVQLVLDSRTQSVAAGIRGEEILELIVAIVNEAVQLAKSSVASETASDLQPYPTDELQWLSTVLFNLAVDLYVAEKGSEAQAWAQRAVEVAEALGLVEQAQDGVEGASAFGGRLAVLLREKGKQIGWKL